MNGREGYITTKITQSGKEARRPRERREASGMREELGILVLRHGNPFPWDIGSSDSVCFSSPKQAVASSEPNFWTYSLQIHYNGLGLKTATLQLVPFVEKLLVQ